MIDSKIRDWDSIAVDKFAYAFGEEITRLTGLADQAIEAIEDELEEARRDIERLSEKVAELEDWIAAKEV